MSVPPEQNSESSEDASHLQIPLWKRILFGTAAGFFFLLGATGLIVPGLPTTPFLLLTSYFLVRSVPSLNDRLLKSKLFGPILTDWQRHRGVRKDVKLKAVAAVVLAISATLWFSSLPVWANFGIVLLAAIGVSVILRLPTLM